MELMSEQQFNALSDVEKYNVYKDLIFKRFTARYEWENIINYAKDGNLFASAYYTNFTKEIVDAFGYEYVVEKLIEAQKKKAEEESKDE